MDEQSRPLGEMADFTEATDPFGLFRAWIKEAEAAEPVDPEAMALATVDADGLPNVRMILLKGADERGLVFYTNCDSAKGLELAANPKAALLFYWKSLGRQIRLRGTVEPATDAEAAITRQLDAVATAFTEPPNNFPLTPPILTKMKALSGAEFVFIPRSGEPVGTLPPFPFGHGSDLEVNGEISGDRPASR